MDISDTSSSSSSSWYLSWGNQLHMVKFPDITYYLWKLPLSYRYSAKTFWPIPTTTDTIGFQNVQKANEKNFPKFFYLNINYNFHKNHKSDRPIFVPIPPVFRKKSRKGIFYTNCIISVYWNFTEITYLKVSLPSNSKDSKLDTRSY